MKRLISLALVLMLALSLMVSCGDCLHAETELVNVKDATCTENGYTGDVVCKECGDTVKAGNVINAGHQLVYHEAKAPTVESVGWDAYYSCQKCSYTTYVEIPKLNAPECEHENTTVVSKIDATCTTNGYTGNVVCSDCGDTVSVGEVTVGTHTLTQHAAQAPTLTSVGWNAYESCSKCSYTTYVELPKLEPEFDTIASVHAGAVGEYEISGTVVGVNARSFLVKDDTGAILVYLNAAPSVALGDVVTVKGATTTYATVKQFTSSATVTKTGAAAVNHGTPSTLTASGISSVTSVIPSFVKITGSLEVSGNYVNLVLDGANKKVSLTYLSGALKTQAEELDGWIVEVMGYTTGVITSSSNGTFLNIMLVSISGIEQDTPDYTNTDFTPEEKELLSYYGEVIPFIPNNDYYTEEYSQYYEDEGIYEYGIGFYVSEVTVNEFNAYLEQFSSYTNDGTQADGDGDTWYMFSGDDFYIDMVHYLYDGTYYLDVYVYFYSQEDLDGGSGGGGSTTETPNLITNDGKGLPTGQDGVYEVDFTDAIYVKDVTDQGYYLDGCPTTGTPSVLVIPVEFSDARAIDKNFTIENIIRAFTGGEGETDYYSVAEYYRISSFGKLNLDVTVIDEWFCPQYTSDYYKSATIDYFGNSLELGDQLVIDEAIDYLSTIMDLSEFDSDNNGTIDSVVIINTLDIDSESTFNWAFRYWNLYTDDEGNYFEYDGVCVNDYLWASYSFMHEKYDESENDIVYTDTSVMNTYTFIHEFGHVLGADDYYDTSYSGDYGPMHSADIMDSMTGDHNAYSKFNYGWLTSSRLVVAEDSVTLTLEDFSKNGDTIIIANNWDPTLGAYQEYYILVYYTNNGLNAGDGYGYFSRDGIVVYHVNASLYSEEYDGEIYYDVYNNNTDASDDYGTADNLIEYVKSAPTDEDIEGTFTYVVGTPVPTIVDDSGNELIYTFTVDELTADYATITFTRNN